MKRKTAINKPLAILTSDWHLRETQPLARTDDFMEAQWRKVQHIKGLQKEYGCPVVHAGDLFHHWKPSPWLLSQCFRHLPDEFYTIYGNHDLPQHNLDLREKSGVNVLAEAGRIEILEGVHWGQTPVSYPELIESPGSDERILVWHIMTWKGEPPYPDCEAGDAYRLLRAHPRANLILTGHNHQQFVARMDGRTLVNPGGITRQEADEVDVRPAVYFWYGGGEVGRYELPFDEGVISREHIEEKKSRDHRIEAFVSKLKDEWETSLSFEDNLERFFAINKTRPAIKEIIYESLDADLK